jgi:hypothetical protein
MKFINVVGDTGFVKVAELSGFPKGSNLQIYNSINDTLFYILNGNSINIYNLNNFQYINKLTIDSIKKITYLQNSLDSNFIIILDDKQSLYRIKNKDVMLLPVEDDLSINEAYYSYTTQSENNIKIYFTTTKQTNVNVKIFDMLGNLVDEKQVSDSKGENSVNFDFSRIEPAPYFYSISYEGEVKYGKFIFIK